ncbi:DNA repair protein complementing XP-A cells homolog Xpac isoform 1-T1 [Aphomia sociella]
MSETDEPAAAGGGDGALTAAQRARSERNRLRARALRDARPLRPAAGVEAARGDGSAAIDSGGGFLLEGDESAPPAPRPRPAPVVDPSARPRCLDCGRLFPQSFLFDAFDHSVCDDCRSVPRSESRLGDRTPVERAIDLFRDDEGAHSLMPRTEAKSEFLLKDCDLDSRPPPLRCVRRRNPHRAGYGEMRLYLRAQLEERALLVWGSEALLRAERERRERARDVTRRRQARRRLRELRLDVRSSAYGAGGARAAHEHRFGPERYDAAADGYERTCDECGHVERYEKM